MAVGQEGPWHSVNSDIYHDNPNCQTGNSIEPENIRRGTGGNRLCEECARLEGVRERAREQGGPEDERLEKQAEARLRDIDRRIEALRASLG